MEDLIELTEVVRRVVAARVRDPHLVEDLTQETLVHVAAADHALDGGSRQAYAIVTARNLVVSHARSESVHDRHAHRLVDYTTLAGPEQLTLDREETGALAVALERLDADERALLLRHEVDGVTTEALAADGATTSGAVAMRLARARATLRLEFLLAFRRLALPTAKCRPVLLALSAGDRRRQDRLAATAHLVRCPTCASLAGPVSERRRGIAAWLLIPVAEGLRRVFRSFRHNHVTQVAGAAVAATAVLAAVLVARPADRPAAAPVVTTTAAPTTVAAPPAPAPPPTTVAAAITTITVATTTATASVDCQPLPLEQLDPAAAFGCPVAPTSLAIVEVPIDEGFWGRAADGRDVWVQLDGLGESAVDIVPGGTVVVTGVVTPPDPGLPIATDPRAAAAGFVLLVPFDAVLAG